MCMYYVYKYINGHPYPREYWPLNSWASFSGRISLSRCQRLELDNLPEKNQTENSAIELQQQQKWKDSEVYVHLGT